MPYYNVFWSPQIARLLLADTVVAILTLTILGQKN